MATFRVVQDVHEALVQRVRAIVREVAESEGLVAPEVLGDLSQDPPAGDDWAVYVVLSGLRPNRELNFGPARRAVSMPGTPATTAGIRSFQAPPLHLHAGFVITCTAPNPRAQALVMAAVATALHFDGELLAQPVPFTDPGPGGTAFLTAPSVDSRGSPLPPRRPAPARSGTATERFSLLMADDLDPVAMAQLLSSHDRPLRATLQVRVPVQVDAPVEWRRTPGRIETRLASGVPAPDRKDAP